jgi:hypothetical protein
VLSKLEKKITMKMKFFYCRSAKVIEDFKCRKESEAETEGRKFNLKD